MNCTQDPRVGLQLTRYHSWPRLREQSVGEHSAQVMRVLLSVWPDAPRHLLVHCLVHDIGEMAGDIQYPYKKKVPGLKEKADAAEMMVRQGMREEFGLPNYQWPSPFEYAVFKVCECIEMWEWALHEQNLGNRYAQMVGARMLTEKSRYYESICDGDVVVTDEEREAWPAIAQAIKDHVRKRANWEK